MSIAAKELPDRRIVLQARVASMLSRPASITQAVTSALAGYEVLELPHELQSLYPLQVCPPVYFAASFFDLRPAVALDLLCLMYVAAGRW